MASKANEKGNEFVLGTTYSCVDVWLNNRIEPAKHHFRHRVPHWSPILGPFGVGRHEERAI